MKIILLTLIIFINPLYGIDITPISIGEKSPIEGYVISKDEMKKLRQINEEKKLLEEKAIVLEDLKLLNEKRLQVYDEAYTKVSKDLRYESFKGDFKGIGGFFLGVAVSSLTFYAITKTTK